MVQEPHIKQLNSSLDSLREDIEEMEEVRDIEPLDVKISCNLEGQLRNIILVVSTGGPHIEIDLGSKMINGYWGSDERNRSLYSQAGEDSIERLWDFYERQWEAQGGRE